MKVKNLAKKFLCIASAVAMAAALMAEPIQVQAAGEVYTSELTGLPISASLKDQRPIAVMVDNEKVALKHFGTAEADIVYEMMNSTANDRITRLMCIYKDYNSVPTIGSIRSIRPTNVILAGEYNAICVHDGGPYYINEWLAKPWSDNLSAGFARSFSFRSCLCSLKIASLASDILFLVKYIFFSSYLRPGWSLGSTKP